jgi:hypothetical protein
MWQDNNGNMQMNWQDDGGDWKGPSTFPALNGSDSGTNIACLTPTAYPATQLTATWDMSRCYFQAGGSLKEVLFDGQNWSVVGIVPTV